MEKKGNVHSEEQRCPWRRVKISTRKNLLFLSQVLSVCSPFLV